jgi:hypothetical protein
MKDQQRLVKEEDSFRQLRENARLSSIQAVSLHASQLVLSSGIHFEEMGT